MITTLQKYNLTPDNSVVIGSGILQALGIRKSNDIDIVADAKIFSSLKQLGIFNIAKKRGRETLKLGSLEIIPDWYQLGKHYYYEDLKSNSMIIDGVRYITLDFLYRVKKSWLKEKDARQKDIKDLELIEKYLNRYYS